MIFLLNCFGFLSLCCVLAILLEEPVTKIMPAAVSIWILTLYLLALIRRLHWIDGFCLLCLAGLTVLAVRRLGREAGKRLAAMAFSSDMLALYVVLTAALLLRGIVFSHTDTIGCWALEVKSIAYFDGFAPAFKNAAIDYGSYSPGTTLFRWWTYHLLPDEGDGMLAVGSAWLFVLLLAPLFSQLRCRRILAPFFGVGAAGLLLFLPGTLDLQCYSLLCAELPISAAYGQGLCALLDKKDRATVPRLSAAVFCMSFFKGAGIGFALSVPALFLLLRKPGENDSRGDGAYLELDTGRMCASSALCLLPALSWTIYCRLTARSSYFKLNLPTGREELALIWGKYGYPFLSRMFRATVSVPLHGGNAVINLTLVLMLMGYGLLFWLLARGGYLPKRETAVCASFFCGMLALMYLVLFIMHTFVFQEPWYCDSSVMLTSISRYGQPILLGWLVLLIHLFLTRGSRRRKACAAAALTAFVLLCSPMGSIVRLLAGTPETIREKREIREQTCAKFEGYLSDRETIPQDTIRTVMVVYQYTDWPTWIVRLQYLAVPDSILHYEVPLWDMADSPERILELARQMHAEYLYCCEMGEDVLAALSQGETIENGHLYPIPDP